MLNETNTMSGLLSKVKKFSEFAKRAATENEKEQLQQDSNDIKKEIETSNVDSNFRKSLIAALMSAGLFLTPDAHANDSSWPMFNKISNRVESSIDQASDILKNITCVIINAGNDSKRQKGVIGKGILMDGNKFLEYADGGKLVYRADLGKPNTSTYFTANQRYKNTTWDDAIIEIHPIDSTETDDE